MLMVPHFFLCSAPEDGSFLSRNASDLREVEV